MDETSVERLSLKVVDRIDAMVAYWDCNQICRFANEAYRSWFGRSRLEMIGITMQDLLGPLYALNLAYILGALRGEDQVFERQIPLPDGRIRHSLATYSPDIVDGVVVGFFVHVADISLIKHLEVELKLSKERAEYHSLHDWLTGLPNRMAFSAQLESAIAARSPFVLMMIDLNDFKAVNDALGHTAGDHVLAEIANRISLSVRRSDMVCRWGGDEFTVLCLDAETRKSFFKLESAIHKQLEKPMEILGSEFTPSATIGWARFPEDGESSQELMAAADADMYRRKLQRHR